MSPVLVVFDWVRRQVARGVGQSVSLGRQTEDEAVCLGPQVAPEWGGLGPRCRGCLTGALGCSQGRFADGN